MKCHDSSCSAARFVPPHFCRNSPGQTGLYTVFFRRAHGLKADESAICCGFRAERTQNTAVRQPRFCAPFVYKVSFHTALSCTPASPSESAPPKPRAQAAPQAEPRLGRRRAARRKRSNVHIMFLYRMSSCFPRRLFRGPLSAGRALSRSRSAVRRSTA